MTLFDAYLFIDWSGSSTPKRGTDSIWIGETVGRAVLPEVNSPTRAQAAAHARARLLEHVGAGRRVLIGFDFPYGYPAGLSAALWLDGDPWSAIWQAFAERIRDDEKNCNNRFAVASALNLAATGTPGPFWMCPAAHATPTLTPKCSVPFPVSANGHHLERLRTTETRLPGVQETWKLYGAGSVGSQTLLGIPRLHALRNDAGLRGCSAVWPFETGFTSDPAPDRPFVLHAEICPGIVDGGALAAELASTGAIRDQAQVRLMCRWAREHDVAASLGAWFDRPAGLDDRAAHAARVEEGWILGCPGPGSALVPGETA